MARKESKPPEGAPDWLVTYGDMVTLLLCFFVLMFAYTVTDPLKYEEVKGSLKRALSGPPVRDIVVTPGSDTSDLLTKLETKVQPGGPIINTGPVSRTSAAMRDTTVLVLGGNVIFEQGSARILDSGKATLDALVTLINGTRNTIEIRGHTSGEADDALAGKPEFGKWDLSWERSYAVMQYLTENGEPEERFRVSGSGRFEPTAPNYTNDQQQEKNRRIELIVHGLGWH